MEAWKIFTSVLAFSFVVYTICWSAIRQRNASGFVFAHSVGNPLRDTSQSSRSGNPSTRINLDEFHGSSTVGEATLRNSTGLGIERALSKYILLLTYYRGGSTFLGEIFAQHPDVFYWFEPLRGLLGNVYGDIGEYKPRVKHFLNMEEQYVRKSRESFVFVQPTIVYIPKCTRANSLVHIHPYAFQ